MPYDNWVAFFDLAIIHQVLLQLCRQLPQLCVFLKECKPEWPLSPMNNKHSEKSCRSKLPESIRPSVSEIANSRSDVGKGAYFSA